jgi:hypothetical protein
MNLKEWTSNLKKKPRLYNLFLKNFFPTVVY